jgi:hypothetical protein
MQKPPAVLGWYPLAKRQESTAGDCFVMFGYQPHATIITPFHAVEILQNLETSKEKLDPFDMMIVQVEPFAPLA